MTNSCGTRTATGRSWAALGILTLAVMLLAIDGTVLTLAIPALTADLAPSASQILWIGDIYSFTLSGLLVVMGNLADRIGRKRLLMIGSVGFGLSSLLAAFATSPELLIAARALLGISGATIMPSTLALIRSVFPDQQQRTRAIAIWSAGATAGAAIGPIVGGALLERFPWGSVFLINVPVMVAVVAGGLWLLPESRNPGKGRIDLLSAVLSMVAIISLVQAVKEIFSAGFTVTAAVALALGTATGWWFLRRQRTLTTPLIDISLFRNRSFTAAVTADTVTIFAFVGLLFYVTSADSGALVMANLCSELPAADTDARPSLRILWAAATGILTIGMLMVGGIPALQSATIIMAIPFALVLMLVMVGLNRALREEHLHEQAVQRSFTAQWASPETAISSGSWRRRLSLSLDSVSSRQAEERLQNVIRPALDEVAEALQERGVPAVVREVSNGLQQNVSRRVQLEALSESEDGEDFVYPVQIRRSSATSCGARTIGTDDVTIHLEVAFGEGLSYNIYPYECNQICNDVLDHYERYELVAASRQEEATLQAAVQH